MKDVMTSGTGTPAYFGTDMAQAGKSGTTTSNRDALFAGYTPYYTCVVWGGYDDNSKQTVSTAYPKVLWKAVMKRIHAELPTKDFEMPSTITQETVCAKSGLLPKAGVCSLDARGNLSYTEYFSESNLPTETCNTHALVTLCKSSGLLAGPYCPSSDLVTRACIVGAESGSADAAYRSPGLTCTFHNENFRENDGDSDEGEEPAEEEEPDDADEPAGNPGGSPALAVTALWIAYFRRRRRQ
jgi:penicillin-binding protein 1A